MGTSPNLGLLPRPVPPPPRSGPGCWKLPRSRPGLGKTRPVLAHGDFVANCSTSSLVHAEGSFLFQNSDAPNKSAAARKARLARAAPTKLVKWEPHSLRVMAA